MFNLDKHLFVVTKSTLTTVDIKYLLPLEPFTKLIEIMIGMLQRRSDFEEIIKSIKR